MDLRLGKRKRKRNRGEGIWSEVKDRTSNGSERWTARNGKEVKGTLEGG